MRPWELKTRRKSAGLTQAGLAALIGMSAQAIAYWERGLKPMPVVADIALTTVLADIEAGRRVAPTHIRDAPPKRGRFATWLRRLATTYL